MNHTEAYQENTNKRSPVAVFIFILGSLSAFGPLTIDMYLPALPTIADELGTTTSMTQLSLTACLIGLAVGQLVMGPLSDVRGRKKPLIIALGVYMLASFLCLFTGSIWSFVALRLLQGLSGAAGLVISRATARDLFSGPELTKFFALLMLVNGLAPILAPVAGGQLLQVMPWRGIFGVLTGLGLIMLLAAALFLEETLPEQNRKTGGLKETIETFGSLIKDRTFMGYVLSKGFIMSGMFAYISGSTFVLQEVYELSAQQFSLVFAVNGLGLVAATQLTGWLSQRISGTALFRYGLLQAFVGGILLVGAALMEAPVILICLTLFLAVTSVGIVNTTVFALAMENQAAQAGSASALLGLLPFLLGAIASPLVGLGDGALPMALVIASCSTAAVLFYMLLNRPVKHSVS
ncbi:Bcr/CflA family efflux MFS transporter [Halobacillus litoralis]|uniref:Bcr/CflA family efflux transporter n=1 Tax=Halobacillus litoralis TaxID=45668 RepID=A0A845E5W2_9BACI|nr:MULTISPECIES: multidrug effflux MFS transporter [Halobacillus]MYL21577.1 Bcr/CflA family efflux MFS transporter [Halobacillus litoralis]MYL29969.1 Bcr/CflA family efflux MFS transporter [Halobacillus halophilus]MYL37567.1 Bcr/CflA family efflux MFS transporter [Halobacillus litoralis]